MNYYYNFKELKKFLMYRLWLATLSIVKNYYLNVCRQISKYKGKLYLLLSKRYTATILFSREIYFSKNKCCGRGRFVKTPAMS